MTRSCHGFGITSNTQCHQYFCQPWTLQSRSILSRRSSAKASLIVNHAMNQWCQYIISMRSAYDHALKKLILASYSLCRILNRLTNAFAVFSGFHHFFWSITPVSSIYSRDCLRLVFCECQNRWTYEYHAAYNVQYFEFAANSFWFKNSSAFQTRDNGDQKSDLKSSKLNLVTGANESSSAPYILR